MQAASTPTADVIDDGFAPPATADGYRFVMPREGTAPAVEQMAAVKAALFAVGLPAPIAAAVDQEYNVAPANPPDEVLVQSTRVATMNSLAKIFGADEVPKSVGHRAP